MRKRYSAETYINGILAGNRIILAQAITLIESQRNEDEKLAKEVLKHGLPAETLLTVNIPNLPEKEIKGVMITAQGKSKWEEEMVERSDTYGQPYYWLRGVMTLYDSGLEADEYAVRHGYISVTPISYDLTNYRFMETLRQWNLKK